MNSGFKLRIEIFYEATLICGLGNLAVDGREVIDAKLFAPDALPQGMPEAHTKLIQQA